MRAVRLRGRWLGTAALALVPAFALAGCTKTIDSSSAEQLIKNSVNSAGNFKVKSVSCPSSETAKKGATFDCQLTVIAPDGSQHSGTVTIHQLDDNGHIHADSSDFHIQ
jgi:VCBS repeat-containing protein